jgi:MFS family permease
MKGNLGATLSEVGWVITAYAIGNVIVVPMTSWLSPLDLYSLSWKGDTKKTGLKVE